MIGNMLGSMSGLMEIICVIGTVITTDVQYLETVRGMRVLARNLIKHAVYGEISTSYFNLLLTMKIDTQVSACPCLYQSGGGIHPLPEGTPKDIVPYDVAPTFTRKDKKIKSTTCLRHGQAIEVGVSASAGGVSLGKSKLSWKPTSVLFSTCACFSSITLYPHLSYRSYGWIWIWY